MKNQLKLSTKLKYNYLEINDLNILILKLLFYFGLLVWALFAPSGASAQIVVNSVDDCIKLAYENNFELRQIRLNQKVENQNLQMAKANLLPQLKFTTALDDNLILPASLIPAQFFGGKEGDFQVVRFGTQYNLTASLEANVPLLNTTHWKNLKVNQLNKQIIDKQLKAKELEINENIIKAYYTAQLNQIALEIARKNLKITDSILILAKQKLQDGIIEPLELNRAQNTLWQQQNAVLEAELNWKKNLNNLKNLIGLNYEQNLQIIDNQEFNFDTRSQNYFIDESKLPNYEVKRLQMAVAETHWQREQLKRLPELSLIGRYSQQAQRNQFNFFDPKQPWFGIGLLGLRLDLPIFNGFSRSANIQKSYIQKQIAENEWKNYQEKAKIEEDDLQNAHTIARQLLDNAQKSYQLSSENYQIARIKYQNGVFSYDQLLNIQNEWLNAENQYLNKLANFFQQQGVLKLKSAL
jgi:outer membrane protein TolC